MSRYFPSTWISTGISAKKFLATSGKGLKSLNCNPAAVPREETFSSSVGISLLSGSCFKAMYNLAQNYSMNYILKDWYTGWPDLRAYVRSLLIRVTAIRFLLFSHPRLYAIMRQHISSAAHEEGSAYGEVDKAAVEMCYKFVRNIGHSPELNTRIEAILNDLGLISWESDLQFLRF